MNSRRRMSCLERGRQSSTSSDDEGASCALRWNIPLMSVQEQLRSLPHRSISVRFTPISRYRPRCENFVSEVAITITCSANNAGLQRCIAPQSGFPNAVQGAALARMPSVFCNPRMTVSAARTAAVSPNPLLPS
jgi:hypothetical protein